MIFCVFNDIQKFIDNAWFDDDDECEYNYEEDQIKIGMIRFIETKMVVKI